MARLGVLYKTLRFLEVVAGSFTGNPKRAHSPPPEGLSKGDQGFLGIPADGFKWSRGPGIRVAVTLLDFQQSYGPPRKLHWDPQEGAQGPPKGSQKGSLASLQMGSNGPGVPVSGVPSTCWNSIRVTDLPGSFTGTPKSAHSPSRRVLKRGPWVPWHPCRWVQMGHSNGYLFFVG